MRREITNNRLWLIETDLLEFVNDRPGVAFLLETRINDFHKRNEFTLKLLHKRMHEIQKKYIVHTAINKPEYAETKEGEKKEWKYLESVTGSNGQLLTGEAVGKAYHDEADEFLNRTVKVEL